MKLSTVDQLTEMYVGLISKGTMLLIERIPDSRDICVISSTFSSQNVTSCSHFLKSFLTIENSSSSLECAT